MKNMGIIVMTSDKYRDVWTPFYYFMEKYWADCSYPIYHVSERERPATSFSIQHIEKCPKDSWNEVLSIALKKIPQDYILLLLSDFFLLRQVNSTKIEEYLNILEKEDAAFLRIFPCPGPHYSYKNYLDIGLIEKKTPYSISTQATIWKKNDLLNFICKFKDDSELEILGSKRSDELEKDLLCVKVIDKNKKLEEQNYPFTYLCTAVIQGKWKREAIKLCNRENLKLNLNYRKQLSFLEEYYYYNHNKIPVILRKIIFFLISLK
jgi:hypothetical protein